MDHGYRVKHAVCVTSVANPAESQSIPPVWDWHASANITCLFSLSIHDPISKHCFRNLLNPPLYRLQQKTETRDTAAPYWPPTNGFICSIVWLLLVLSTFIRPILLHATFLFFLSHFFPHPPWNTWHIFVPLAFSCCCCCYPEQPDASGY